MDCLGRANLSLKLKSKRLLRLVVNLHSADPFSHHTYNVCVWRGKGKSVKEEVAVLVEKYRKRRPFPRVLVIIKNPA